METKEYKLGDLLMYEQPTAYIVKSTDYNDNNPIPVLTAGKSFILGYTNEREGVFDQLPVIIFDDFTTATQYVDFKFKVKSSAMKILHINTELVNPKYIYYRLQIIQVDSSTHKRYWIQQYSKIKIQIPSLPEQEKVVLKIEELFSDLDNAIEMLKIADKKINLYKQSVVREAFTGSFSETYRKTNMAKIDVKLPWVDDEKALKLPQIPSTWKYVYLSNLGDLGRGRSKHRPRNDTRLFENGTYPFIQTGEVKAADKYITKYHKMYNDVGLAQSKIWPKGTLCITIAANIAETAFLGIDACFPDSVVGFTPSKYVNVEFVRYFIESQKAQLSAFAPATAQKNINLTTLENLIIPYCCLDEQDQIVNEIEARLTVCFNIKKTINEAMKQAVSMKQSILKHAFEGGFV